MKLSSSEKKRLKNKKLKFAKWKKFYPIVFFIGLILAIFEISLYRKTIIPLFIPFLVISLVSICSFTLNRKHFNNTNNSEGWFFPLIQNVVSWGFISGYLFLAANYYFAEQHQVKCQFQIIGTSSMPGSKGHRGERKPTVLIDYSGFKKELIFNYSENEKVKNGHKVDLLVRKGLFGFDILEHYDIVEDGSW